MAELHVIFYCNGGLIRAYKYLDEPKNSTASTMHFLYSQKAKRYIVSYLYFRDWNGEPLDFTPDYQHMRYALNRIGLEMR